MNPAICDDDEVEFGRIDDASRKFGLRRGMIYRFLNEGVIKSRIIRPRGSTGPGVRLLDFNSIRQLLSSAPSKPAPQISKLMRQRAKLPRKRSNGVSEPP
jgi:hypothetical protein